MFRVFLVDDHEIVRHGIADLLSTHSELEVVGESGTVRGTIGKIAATMPNVVVLDVRLPDGDGIELCRAIRSAYPEVRCLILTGHDDDEASRAAVLAGASGYLLKDIRARGIVEAVRAVADGATLISTQLGKQLNKSFSEQRNNSNLSIREKQVLDLITEGLSNREIGERLGLAEKTIKNYVSTLLAKLGVHRRTQVIARQLKHKI